MLIGLGYGLQIHFAEASAGRGVSVGTSLLRTLPVWLFWAPMTPLIAWLGRRFRVERRRWMGTVAVHVLAGVVATVLHALWLVLAFGLSGVLEGVTERAGEMLRMMIVSRLYLDVLTYWAILGGAYAFEYADRFRERDLKATRLESQLTRARLDALRMQLNPHFLFNALNAVASEVRVQRNEEAIGMLVGLSDLLRYALDSDEEPLVPLWKELAFLQRYIDIERARFADRLVVEVDVPLDLHEARVPPLLLQPLVENAIRHGIAPRDASGRIHVSGHAADGRLTLVVRDNGVGLRNRGAAEEQSGLGLANVRERLAELYGERQRFVVHAREGGGVEAIVEIPRDGDIS